MDVNTNFTQVVRELLEKNTQKELSIKTNVSQSIISDLNRGEIKPNFSFKNGAALINALSEIKENKQ